MPAFKENFKNIMCKDSILKHLLSYFNVQIDKNEDDTVTIYGIEEDLEHTKEYLSFYLQPEETRYQSMNDDIVPLFESGSLRRKYEKQFKVAIELNLESKTLEIRGTSSGCQKLFDIVDVMKKVIEKLKAEMDSLPFIIERLKDMCQMVGINYEEICRVNGRAQQAFFYQLLGEESVEIDESTIDTTKEDCVIIDLDTTQETTTPDIFISNEGVELNGDRFMSPHVTSGGTGAIHGANKFNFVDLTTPAPKRGDTSGDSTDKSRKKNTVLASISQEDIGDPIGAMALENYGSKSESDSEPEMVKITVTGVNKIKAKLHKTTSGASKSTSGASKSTSGAIDNFRGPNPRMGSPKRQPMDIGHWNSSRQEAYQMPPIPDGVNPEMLRHIVIDGNNVAFAHSGHNNFSVRGIIVALEYFLKRGHRDVTIILPQHRTGEASELFDSLVRQRLLAYSPSRSINNYRQTPYDDRFIVELAVKVDGVIVSNDQFRDLMTEREEFRWFVENRLLMYTIVGEVFMVPQDPHGVGGPHLDDLLRKGGARPMQHVRSDTQLILPHSSGPYTGQAWRGPPRGVAPSHVRRGWGRRRAPSSAREAVNSQLRELFSDALVQELMVKYPGETDVQTLAELALKSL